MQQEVPRSRGCSWSIHRLSNSREDCELFPLFCLLSLACQLYPQNCPTHSFWTGDSSYAILALPEGNTVSFSRTGQSLSETSSEPASHLPLSQNWVVCPAPEAENRDSGVVLWLFDLGSSGLTHEIFRTAVASWMTTRKRRRWQWSRIGRVRQARKAQKHLTEEKQCHSNWRGVRLSWRRGGNPFV